FSRRQFTDIRRRLKVTATIGALLTTPLLADSTTVINEVLYHPADDSQTEWVELANTMSYDMDLGGWRLTGAVEYAFPPGTTIAASKFLVVAADPSKVRLQSLFDKPLGPFEGKLSNQGELIELRNVSDRLMSWVDYNDREPWPVAPDGSGASLAKRLPETDSASVESWAASSEYGGTPGGRNFQTASESPLRISEVAPAGEQDSFWLEFNTEGASTNLKDHIVGIAGDPQRETALPDLPVSEGGFTVVSGDQLGFGAEDGDLLCLYAPNKTSVIGAVLVDNVVHGWSADHRERSLYPTQATPGEANVFSFNDAVVINEIMYRAYPLQASPPQPPTFEQQNLAGPDSSWRFWQGVPQQDDLWQQVDFDDSEWEAGGPLFSSGIQILPEDSGESTSIKIGKSVYYFRLVFTVDAIGEEQSLQLQHLIDDGAVIYLNGAEVTRVNLPDGAVTASTRATNPIENPVWSEAIVIPSDRLRIGTNVISAEVHQSSAFDRDVAFSVDVSLGKLLGPGIPAQPFRDSSEEWIELYNRSDEAVDVSGWSLDEAIQYDFPEGTTIEPNGYFVVANDPEGYSDSLSNSGENILLRDQNRNPADEVRYYDGGRWPAYADGGGSSLELRDPNADNSLAEAWAASDESNKAPWQEIRYRMVSGQTYGLNTWNELVLGMLTAGEVLVDDVKVIHDPDGEAKQLIQNGGFNNTLFNPDTFTQRWRFVGNHRHSNGVPDPDNPENSVLHIIASGATDTKHNHVETTFVSNTKLIDGDLYEVSMRARWVAGSNQLNMRAYYGRLARTIELDTPDQFGTPGMPNSRFVENIGPTYSGFMHAPLMPATNEAVTVSVSADDPNGVDTLTLHYAKDGDEGFVSVPMEESAGIYTATVPGMAEATVMQLFVEGLDSLGAASYFPAAGQDSRALYIVDDGRSTDLPVHELRLIMKAADFDFMFERLNLISNERIGCSVLVDNREIIYNTGVRLKGSPAGRARDGPLYQGFNIAFPPAQLYRGIHSSVSIDRSGRAPSAGDQDEIYVKHMFNRAGIPAMVDDLGYIVSPTTTHTGTALFSMARYGSVFTNTQFRNGCQGSVFNLEITYDPTSGSSGRESVKNPTPFSHGGTTDFRDLGDDKEQYRWAMEMRTGRRADDYDGLIRFCQTMDLPKDQLARKIDEVMDVDAWLRTAAMHNLCGIGDTWWNGGLQHNMRVYVPQGGNGVVGLPWDLDFVFSAGATSAIKTAPGNLRRVMDMPVNTRLYYGHLLDIIDRVFNAEYMEHWLTHYGSVVGQNLSTPGLNYIRTRGNSVRSRVRADAPAVAFAITTNGGESMSTEATSQTITGDGWINVRTIRLVGQEEPLEVTWTTSKTWELSVPLVSGPNAITLQAVDFQGNDLGSLFSPGIDSITITSTATEATPFENLRITELHYHPAEPADTERDASTNDDDFEFIEMHNLGERQLDLTGVSFTDGIDFVFADGTTLAASAYAVVVRNRAAFEARYGTDIAIIGEYGPASLSNNGERVELRDGPHRILAFDYRDDWASESDGDGSSLVITSPAGARAAWDKARSWGVSGDIGGSPGAPNMPSVDVPVLAEWTQITVDGSEIVASYQRVPNMDYTIELSQDLLDWEPVVLDKVAVAPINDDLELVTIRIPREEQTQYVRIAINP
ncbi:MAG: hypothetical protein ACI9DF_002981, partial [Verrucomicrobiales bacterium]